MTTDTRTKQAVVARDGFTVGGMAKGSGMIHPDLATMLAVVTTDYPLEPGEAVDFLRPAVDESFNAISVDGECSTNDTVVLLANGASGIARTPASDAAFAEALQAVCGELASQIVADGEGATFLAAIDVRGAVDRAQAKAVARRIATSPLVKTALFGRDANWGRVLAAAGSAPYNGGYANVEPELLTLIFNGATVIDRGTPSGRRARARRHRVPHRARPRARRRRGELPDQRPVLRLRPHQRGLPLVKPIVVKIGGARRERGGRARAALRGRRQPGRRRPRRRPADLRRDGAPRPARRVRRAAAASRRPLRSPSCASRWPP